LAGLGSDGSRMIGKEYGAAVSGWLGIPLLELDANSGEVFGRDARERRRRENGVTMGTATGEVS
jgi:hypothetical protein